MTSHIIIDPSCDIHLVLDSDFKDASSQALNDLQFKLFEANFLSSTNLPRYAISPITLNSTSIGTTVFFDFFPLNQSVVTINNTGVLHPVAAGDVLMHVRVRDGSVYHYNIVRIRVHEKMNGWWFGNDSLSVFKDTNLAHSKVSIYALFDGNTNGTGGGIGDISGHGYVALSLPSPDPGFFQINTTYRGRIQGLNVGTTNLKGTLALPKHSFATALRSEVELSINVVDFKGNNLNPNASSNPGDIIPSLHRVDINTTKDRVNQFNILFLSEGFEGGEETKFNIAVAEVKRKLFEEERHAPYNLLEDSFNIWRSFTPSLQKGITSCHDIDSDGYPIPDNSQSSSSNTNAYTLYQLIRLVGLPSPGDANQSISALKSRWNTAGSGARLQGYVNANAEDDIVELWKETLSVGIAQTRNNFYGWSQGVRWGDRPSREEVIADEVGTPASAGNSDPTYQKFAKRVYEWYKLPAPTRSLRFDPRRFALELSSRGAKRFIINRVGRLSDQRAPASTDNHWVGRYWHPGFEINPTATNKQMPSKGLICLLINHEHSGGTKNSFFVLVSVSLKSKLTINSENSVRNIRPLIMNPNISVDHTRITNTLAHEFGHAFNLDDEYEEREGAPPLGNSSVKGDNVAKLSEIHDGATEVKNTAAAPAPIDPDKVKWLKLHRIICSDEIIEPSTISGTNITVKLASGRMIYWKNLHQAAQQNSSSARVFLRNQKAYLEYRTSTSSFRSNRSGDQLPLEATDLFDLFIDSIPNDGSNTIVLRGAPSAAHPFPSGSVMYAPKLITLTEGSTPVPALLVETKPIQFMRTSKLPLSNNQKNDRDFCAPSSKENDNPVSIPDFNPPCEAYKLIGVYEGGGTYVCEVYRPAGACKMRKSKSDIDSSSFDYVCKYLIVNRVNPQKLEELERYYPVNKKK